MKVIYVLTIIAASSTCLPGVHSQERFGTPSPVDGITQHVATSDEAADHKLYIGPDPDKPEIPDNIRIFPLIDIRQADRLAYPSLFSAGRAEGVIVMFGFPTCAFCTMQAAVIPKNYRFLKVNKDDRDAPGGPTWRKLMTTWKVVDTFLGVEAPTYPTTVIVVNGIPTKHFTAYKPWRIIEAHAKAAKYEDERKQDDSKKRYRSDNRRTRTFRNWFRKPTNRHKSQFGRWS